MQPGAIGLQRLTAQAVITPRADVLSVVRHLGLLQAQDLGASKWAVGVRTQSATVVTVDRALDEGQLVRTHALRGTWQLFAPEDVRWVLDLVAPTVLARTSKRERDLALDAETLKRGQRLLAKAVRDGANRTRAELTAALAEGGVAATGPRLGQLLLRAELEQVLCSGPQRGAQITWAAFDDRVPS